MTQNLRDCSEADQQAIREQLDRILASSVFAQSRRRQRFLKYIVGETVAGRGERIKGYNVAREVFDRPETFDASVDPTVRIEAARLRDKLREYYESAGQSDPIRIELPKGSYIPHIVFRQAATLDSASESPVVSTDAAAEDRSPNQAQEPVTLLGERPSPVPSWQKRLMRWQIAVPAVALMVTLSAAGAWLMRRLAPPGETLEGPSIAVLPFANLSGDPKQDYFSDGLTEDILTELSRSRELSVIARNTSFQYKGQAVDVGKLGRELKVRYVLEGSVRRTDDRLRVTAQLIDTETGTHVWADRFDREMADIFLVQDEIVSQIAGEVAGGYGAIESAEAKSAARKSPDEVEAYDLVLRARDIMQWDWSTANINAAKKLLQEAVALDPTSSQARTDLTWLAVIGGAFRYDEGPLEPNEIIDQATKAVDQANKAVLLDPSSARAHMVAAAAHFYTGQLDLFRHETRQALSLAPHDAHIMGILGQLTAFSGDWQRGEAMATKAHALNPNAVAGWYQTTIFYHRYLTDDYKSALDILRQDTNRESPYQLVAYVPLYGQLGLKQQALEAWKKLRATYPNWSVETFETWWRTRNFRDQDLAKLMDGVYKAGVLEAEAKSGQ